jgi:hypothetical protein
MTSVAVTGSLPSLPPGWTEHTAPTGHKYYYNASTKKSTYQRPTAETTQQTPPSAAVTLPETTVKTTTRIPKKEDVVPLTEWSSEVAQLARPGSTERQTARMMGEDPWKKLEDRPRKKYPPILCNADMVEPIFLEQSPGF